jgi:hypothetical protein
MKSYPGGRNSAVAVRDQSAGESLASLGMKDEAKFNKTLYC